MMKNSKYFSVIFNMDKLLYQFFKEKNSLFETLNRVTRIAYVQNLNLIETGTISEN